MTSDQIRRKYIKFFITRGHKEIAPASLVPENDPTTLFTSSGMQSLIPYLLGQEHPAGQKLVNSQPCFRAEDIEEVGDNRHTTFFEMLGNWSLGDYFKKEQLSWIWEFWTEELKLPKEKLHVSVFEGNDDVPKDEETHKIWKSLGLADDHIHFYGENKNWWSRSGPPENMPPGEIGGPDSEVFYDFGTAHDPKFGQECHPNCDCGRFLEIGNSVFIEYQKQEDRSLKELAQKNVDFGGGLERLAAANLDIPDVFASDLFSEAIKGLEAIKKTGGSYEENPKPYRVIVDHLRAAVFMVADGVEPSNKEQGYILRRLIRRAMLRARDLGMERDEWLSNILPSIEVPYIKVYPHIDKNIENISETITSEVDKFRRTIREGLKEFDKYVTFGEVGKPETKKKMLSPQDIFRLYESHGFPYELSKEEGEKRGIEIPSKEEFDLELEKHQELSRTTSAGKFAGGLANHSEATIRGHTATHLLHQALRDVLGPSVHQTGSNITPERIRFDFAFNHKLTNEELQKVENIINEKIKEDLPVHFEIIPLAEAKTVGAIGLFDEKYKDDVKVYFIGPWTRSSRSRRPYSAEFCGGPHVEHTGKIRHVKITKETASGTGSRRIYMTLAR